MRKLYRFYWYCGRQGELEGLFVADEEEVKKAIGQHLWFGEVLGKHSDISGTLDEKDIKVLTDDQDFIDKAIKFGIIPTGFNPINRLITE